jgi:hypothetical protein
MGLKMKNRKRKSMDEFLIYLLRRFPEDLKRHMETALKKYQCNMDEVALIGALVLAIKAKKGIDKIKANYFLKQLNQISAGKDVLRLSLFVKIIKLLGMRLILVSVNELWIYKNPKVLYKIKRGLESAAKGDIVKEKETIR